MRVETSWFGPGRKIIQENKNPQPIPNPSYQKTASRDHSNPLYLPFSLTDHSPSGLTNLEAWLNYLFNIRFGWFPVDDYSEFYQKKNTIILIADSYPVHFAKASQRYASLLNILQICVPEGLTDILQNLGSMIFGNLKSHARGYINSCISDQIMSFYIAN